MNKHIGVKLDIISCVLTLIEVLMVNIKYGNGIYSVLYIRYIWNKETTILYIHKNESHW